MDSGISANEGHVPPQLPLEYARRSLRPPATRHSFYGALALAMAAVTMVWLYCVQTCRPRYHQGGPVWYAFWDNAFWPGGIGLVLAVLGLVQPGRKRVLSVIAIVGIVLAYVLCGPPMNFA